MKLYKYLSPYIIVGATLFICFSISFASMLLVTAQPFSSVRLTKIENSLKVEAIFNNTLMSDLKVGDEVIAVWIDNDRYLLKFYSIWDSKDISTFDDYNDFFAYQKSLQITKDSEKSNFLFLEKKDGNKVILNVAEKTKLVNITPVFWKILVINVCCILMAVSVWLLKPYRLESGLLLLSTIGHYGLFTAQSVFLSRDLLATSDLLKFVMGFEVISMHLFAFNMFALQTSYPMRLLSIKSLAIVAIIHLFLGLNYFFQYVSLPHIFFFQFIPGFFVAMLFTAVQWYKSKVNPVNRAAILVTQLSVVIPSLVLIFLYAIPLVLKVSPLISEDVILIMPLFLFVGWAIAILRYRLFDFEFWWLKVLIYLFVFGLFLFLDMFFVYIFNLRNMSSLSLSALAILLLYFFLRQFFFAKLFIPNKNARQALPHFCEALSVTLPVDNVHEFWITIVSECFKPLHIMINNKACSGVFLEDDGLHLIIPSFRHNQSLCLIGKKQGRSLFNNIDVKLVKTFLRILQVVILAGESQDAIVIKERERIMRDLHDTLGAKLLTLSRTLANHQQQQAVQETLQCLREMISLNLRDEPPLLGEFLADIRWELVESCDSVGMELIWEMDAELENLQLTIPQLIEISSFISCSSAKLIADKISSIVIKICLLESRVSVVIVDCCHRSDAKNLTHITQIGDG